MEIRKFAERILFSESLEAKLRPLEGDATDCAPGEPLWVRTPARPANLRFAARRKAPPMPGPAALRDKRKRAIAHHIMANHELQALEVMAFVLCAFPEAPAAFRRGMVDVMHDEQRHTRMHAERAATLGIAFGDLPVNGYIWKKAQHFRCLLDYLAGLPLTFEGRNLDHTLHFEEHFRQAGDRRSAAVMRIIHRDEIRHVAFGIEWLRRLKPPGQSDWDVYCAHLHWPLRPAKASAQPFHRAPRRAAGMDEEFLDRLQHSVDDARP